MSGITIRRLFGNSGEWARDLAFATAAGIFLGLVGPFGSYLNESRWLVLTYWVGALWVGTVLFGLIVGPVARGGLRLKAPRPVLILVAAAMAAIPLAAICRLAALALWPESIRQIGLGAWYGQTLVISAPFAVGYVLFKAGKTGPQTLSAEPGVGEPPAETDLFARLPPHLGRDVVALQMEDHYVRVHTRAGSTLLLMPMRQAIGALSAPGVRIHRSWWVAHDAVAGSLRDGRNLRLRLVNGLEAPIARTSIAEARAAGLLRADQTAKPIG